MKSFWSTLLLPLRDFTTVLSASQHCTVADTAIEGDATAKAEWEVISEGASTISSLPSAVLAATMEVEDEEDGKRVLGQLREAKKVLPALCLLQKE